MPTSFRLLTALLLTVTIAGAAIPVSAQIAPPTLPQSNRTTATSVQATGMPSVQSVSARPAPADPGPSAQAVGGLNCLMLGSAAALGVYVYNDVLMVAVTGYINPTLLIPAMATAFVAGCGVGNTLTPGLLYLRSWID